MESRVTLRSSLEFAFGADFVSSILYISLIDPLDLAPLIEFTAATVYALKACAYQIQA